MRLFKNMLMLAALMPLSVMAQVNLQTEAFRIQAVKQADGSITEEWQKPEKIVPGDLVGYRIHYANTGKEKADNVVINNPVPEKTDYLANSASGMKSQITYSADQGKSFARAAELSVMEDGKQRPARANEVTNIRWTLESVAPGASGHVEFKVRVQ
jgi:uncharacterized repeat protein (TIGR01451 family)